MGTVVSLDARGVAEAAAKRAFGEAMAWLREVDRRFSTYREDSEVNRIDRGELPVAEASSDVRRVLERCAALRDETRGAFDAHVGGRLDPSAYVKGWATRRAAEILESGGIENFALNAGGDVVVRGDWRVGIQHPRDRGAIATAIGVTDTAVATSGAYERGHHVIDPRTGAPAAGVLSVTVVGPHLGDADAYSTAAFALGIDGPSWTLGLAPYEAMTILADERVLRTPGFPAAKGPA